MNIETFINDNLKDVNNTFFGIDSFTFYGLRCECVKRGFLGGGVHKTKVYYIYLNGKLIRAYLWDFESVLNLTKRYAKITAKKRNIQLN